jgi:hypothetical protein
MQFNSIQLNSMLLLESVSCNTTLIVTMTLRCHNKTNDETATATTTTNDRDDEDDGNAAVLDIHPSVQYIVVMGDYSNGVRHVWRRASPKQHNLESVMRNSVFGMVAMCCGVEWSGYYLLFAAGGTVQVCYGVVIPYDSCWVRCGVGPCSHTPPHHIT